MSSHAETPHERADAFMRIAADFRLGDLVTESAHPRSVALSDIARADTSEGLAVLFDVDRDVVARFRSWAASGQPERMASAVTTALRRGGRVFFTGCGATGRLSIQLDSIWRAFWQSRRDAGLNMPSPARWEACTRSVMAGGDYALIKAVEGFEDLTAFGRKQIADLGLSAADVVCAITEGGETSFVIGTAWQGVDVGARVFFVYNNPDDVLRATVRRSREVLDDPRIEKVNLTTGPMAITGSTRMQATSIQLLALMTVLEMVLREILAADGALDRALGPASGVPASMAGALEATHAELASGPLRRAAAALVEREEHIYRSGGKTSYFADAIGVDVLTDTTERSPTFCTASFRKWDDPSASESWAFLFTPEPVTESAWPRLLRRAPQTIEWTTDDLRRMIDDAAVERQGAVLGEIGLHELMRFRIGLDGLAHRPFAPGDGAMAILAEADARHVAHPSAAFAAVLASAVARGATATLIAVGRRETLDRLRADAGRAGFRIDVALCVPDAPFLLDPMVRIGIKMLLNAVSTCTMVRLGRVLGNRMIWVAPNNLKLVDRSIRYIRDLTGASYDEACCTLFEVIDYIEPRRSSGQAFPAPVGVATMRLRHGLSLEAAEARLLAELG
jgi:N-acetylmuramic acid 6-phosphate etherase